MTDLSDLFWQASLSDIKRGYLYDHPSDAFICLICGQSFVNGVIYPYEDQLFAAPKFIQAHIASQHVSPFHFLLNLDKKLTGLTEHQKTLLELFYAGNSDNEVANALTTGSTSTIRNHRFSLRERQKQAKLFLAIMELLEEQVPKRNSFISIPRSSKAVDNRFAITQEESAKVLAAYFKEGLDGPLTSFPPKEKKKIVILRHIMHSFAVNQTYSEKEVNTVLKRFYADYVLLRRYLIEYGFMDRTADGSSYWVKL